jgi:hypothetical protein
MSSLNVPFDVQTEQTALARQQQLIDALQKQAFNRPQGQMVSGHYVKPSFIGQLAPLLSMVAAQQGQGKIDDAQKALAGQYNDRLASGLKQYLGNNVPGQTLSDSQATDLLQNDVDPGHLAEPARDPRTAAATAIGSGIPELKQIGMEDFKALAGAMRKDNTPEEFGTDPKLGVDPTTGQLMQALVGKRGTIKPLPNFAPAQKYEATAGGQLYNPYSGKAGSYLGETFTDPQSVNGEAVSFGTKSNRPVQAATRPPQTKVEVTNQAQKGGFEAWSKLAAATVDDLSSQARGSVKLLGTLNQLERSGQLGTFAGPTADAATFVSNLANTLGVPVDQAKLANSETFRSASISAWQDMIKQAGGNRGVVKEEAQQIMQMVPQLSQSPQGRQQLIAYLRQLANQSVVDAHTAQNEYGEALNTQDSRKFTFGLGQTQIPRPDALPAVPGAGAKSGSSALPLSDSRGWRLHRDANGNAAYVSPDGTQYEEVK